MMALLLASLLLCTQTCSAQACNQDRQIGTWLDVKAGPHLPEALGLSVAGDFAAARQQRTLMQLVEPMGAGKTFGTMVGLPKVILRLAPATSFAPASSLQCNACNLILNTIHSASDGRGLARLAFPCHALKYSSDAMHAVYLH